MVRQTVVAFKGIGRIRSLFTAINICAYNLFIQEMCDSARYLTFTLDGVFFVLCTMHIPIVAARCF